MNSEFGLMHLWAQGDIVTRIVFVILASMSVLSWCVIIIKGLGILRVQGQASIDKVAGPIGEALIMTGFGLAVAIPAVLGYNVLVRGNKAILGRLHRFAHDLHAFYITGARVTAASVEGNIIRMKKA